MITLTISPAYGRDYKSRAAALAAWHEGRDFLNQSLSGGRYVSRSEFLRPEVCSGYTHVSIRYDRLRKVVILSREEA